MDEAENTQFNANKVNYLVPENKITQIEEEVKEEGREEEVREKEKEEEEVAPSIDLEKLNHDLIAYKDEGNKLYKEKRIQESIKKFQEGIEFCDKLIGKVDKAAPYGETY